MYINHGTNYIITDEEYQEISNSEEARQFEYCEIIPICNLDYFDENEIELSDHEKGKIQDCIKKYDAAYLCLQSFCIYVYDSLVKNCTEIEFIFFPSTYYTTMFYNRHHIS